MLSRDKIEKYNAVVLNKISFFLNCHADFIQKDIIDELVSACGLTEEEAFVAVLAQACGIEMDQSEEELEIYEYYFCEMVQHLNVATYQADPYYRSIHLPEINVGDWAFKLLTYQPYEAFVWQDLKRLADGRLMPQIGFFSEQFTYPAVLEKEREWMLLTPNEMETMKEPIDRARGKVLTFGLGLGYYAYRVSEKANVSSITVVEKNPEVIKLFETYILPQFPHKDKVRLLCEDAFVYAEKEIASEHYDVVFTDIWHDPSDGLTLYKRMKCYEELSPESDFLYWIEETIQCYL